MNKPEPSSRKDRRTSLFTIHPDILRGGAPLPRKVIEEEDDVDKESQS